MPTTQGIVGTDINSDRVIFQGSYGGDLTITKEQIIDHYLNDSSGDRQTGTLIWVKNQIVQFFGEEVIVPDWITFDYNTETGSPTRIELSHG